MSDFESIDVGGKALVKALLYVDAWQITFLLSAAPCHIAAGPQLPKLLVEIKLYLARLQVLQPNLSVVCFVR